MYSKYVRIGAGGPSPPKFANLVQNCKLSNCVTGLRLLRTALLCIHIKKEFDLNPKPYRKVCRKGVCLLPAPPLPLSALAFVQNFTGPADPKKTVHAAAHLSYKQYYTFSYGELENLRLLLVFL